MGARYPQQLNLLYPNEPYTLKKIVDILGVTERTVYRWIENDYLEREVKDDGTTTYIVNQAATPDTKAKIAAVKRKYSDDELEGIYQRLKSGELKKVLDISTIIQSNPSQSTLAAVLQALDEFRELFVYVINR